jgi:hypothetical protein
MRYRIYVQMWGTQVPRNAELSNHIIHPKRYLCLQAPKIRDRALNLCLMGVLKRSVLQEVVRLMLW